MFTFEIEGVSDERGATEENKSSLISHSQQLYYKNTHQSFMFLDDVKDKPMVEKEKL